ncbi:MAG: transcriptional repressor [Nitrospiraceae bacterium]|nr:transcriptional repressor [Nitrospiraceae bacterium]
MMAKYKDIGIKLTPQRLAILGYLEGNKAHPSAEDIYNDLHAKYPTMSFATVYTTLATLRAKGCISELSIDPDKKRFDPNTSDHNHLICTSCKRVVDITVPFDLTLPEDSASDFMITGSHVEFFGICPECKKNNRYSREDMEKCV